MSKLEKVITTLGIICLAGAVGLFIWNDFDGMVGVVFTLFAILLTYFACVLVLSVVDLKWSNKLFKVLTYPIIGGGRFKSEKMNQIRGVVRPITYLFGFWLFIFIITFLLPTYYLGTELISSKTSILLSLTIGTTVYLRIGDFLIGATLDEYDRLGDNIDKIVFKKFYGDEMQVENTALKTLDSPRLRRLVFATHAIILFASTIIKFELDYDYDILQITLTSALIIISLDRTRKS